MCGRTIRHFNIYYTYLTKYIYRERERLKKEDINLWRAQTMSAYFK